MKVLLILVSFGLFVVSAYFGIQKEARRQCIVAMDVCEKYGNCDNLCEGEY